jgi:hypothetical protein
MLVMVADILSKIRTGNLYNIWLQLLSNHVRASSLN